MRVIVRNLGVINEAEIDLKPLTVFVGPNSSGKTWLAYLFSAIFSQEGWERYTRALATNLIQDIYPLLENAIQDVLNKGNGSLDLVQFADEQGENYINNVAAYYTRSWLQKYLKTERVTFENLEIQINIGETKQTFLEKIVNTTLEEGISIGLQRKQPLVSVRKEKGKRELYLYTEGNTKGNALETLPLSVIREFLVGSVFAALHRAFYANICVFPTERTAFISTPSFISMPSSNVKALGLDQEQTTSGPLVNFMETISNALKRSSSDRENEVRNNTVITRYIQLANLIENNILAGNLEIATSRLGLLKELLFKPLEGTPLEMTVVSSMVKELAPLVLYLRYLAKPGDLLVIDEPEMNLHPEAQAQLTELFAMLVNTGLHLLITTHSPYIVDHLANLMKAAEHPAQDTIREEFFLQQKEAFIFKTMVSAYLIDEKKANNILGEDGLIYWDTFSDISDRVTRIYSKLL